MKARQVAKYHGATPTTTKVIDAGMLNFKPILDPLLKKIVRGTSILGGGCASKTWSFSSACKNLGVHHPIHPLWADIWYPEKSIWVGTISHRDLQGYWIKVHRSCFA